MDCFGKDHADELRAACKEKISFDGFGISGFEVCKSERILEDIDRSFHKDAVLVEIVPMLCVSRNTGAGSEIRRKSQKPRIKTVILTGRIICQSLAGFVIMA